MRLVLASLDDPLIPAYLAGAGAIVACYFMYLQSRKKKPKLRIQAYVVKFDEVQQTEPGLRIDIANLGTGTARLHRLVVQGDSGAYILDSSATELPRNLKAGEIRASGLTAKLKSKDTFDHILVSADLYTIGTVLSITLATRSGEISVGKESLRAARAASSEARAWRREKERQFSGLRLGQIPDPGEES